MLINSTQRLKHAVSRFDLPIVLLDLATDGELPLGLRCFFGRPSDILFTPKEAAQLGGGRELLYLWSVRNGAEAVVFNTALGEEGFCRFDLDRGEHRNFNQGLSWEGVLCWEVCTIESMWDQSEASLQAALSYLGFSLYEDLIADYPDNLLAQEDIDRWLTEFVHRRQLSFRIQR